MNTSSSAIPASYTVTTLGWATRAIACAFPKQAVAGARRVLEAEDADPHDLDGGGARWRRRSTARYTSPIPPAPTDRSIR